MDNDGQHQRLEYIDIAKGIGIICVILGHMDNDSIKQFVFSFHMPLFFMISGFFLSTKGKPRELFRKRVRALLPPYLLTSIALIAMSCLKNYIQILRGKKELFDLVYDACKWVYAALYGAGTNFTVPFRIISIGAIWFLLASIVSNYLVAKALQTKYPAIFIIVTAIIGYGTSKIVWLPWSIQAGMTASVFVYMGTLLKKNKHVFQKKTSVTFAGAFVLWIIEVMNDWPCLAIVKNQYPNGIFDFIGGGAGAVCVIMIVKALYDHFNAPLITRLLSWMGRNSMVILCAHLFELNMFPWDDMFCFWGIKNHVFVLTLICKVLWTVGLAVFIEKLKMKHTKKGE